MSQQGENQEWQETTRESERHQALERPVCQTKGLSLHPHVPTGGGGAEGGAGEGDGDGIMPNI